jgi:hypothetical protein
LTKNDVLKARIKKVQAEIPRMKHVVNNQTITLDDKKLESDCRELEETIQLNQDFAILY